MVQKPVWRENNNQGKKRANMELGDVQRRIVERKQDNWLAMKYSDSPLSKTPKYVFLVKNKIKNFLTKKGGA
jgi:hypothetical protein